MVDACALAGEPDIYGIGVRTAIYAQNLLSFFPAFWALRDGEVSRTELEGLETQSTTILVTAFAVLISCIIQAVTRQINSFHAHIVLELSWMNNTNTFIWFILYIHHFGWEKGLTALNILSRRFWLFHADSDDSPLAGSSRHKWPRVVILLGTIHLSLMGAVGIWMWSDPYDFGAPIPCNTAEDIVVFDSRKPPYFVHKWYSNCVNYNLHSCTMSVFEHRHPSARRSQTIQMVEQRSKRTGGDRTNFYYSTSLDLSFFGCPACLKHCFYM
ncbi:hypothetical protein DL96DRAFT_880040 [Flagelloscypha sp. PMI_526]|nr:hypothetical protein DL96DRAFT_880040 [Flagelloscypha sp. PMI_526]